MLTDNIDAGVTVNAKMKLIVIECVAFKKVKMNEQGQNKITKKSALSGRKRSRWWEQVTMCCNSSHTMNKSEYQIKLQRYYMDNHMGRAQWNDATIQGPQHEDHGVLDMPSRLEANA